MDQTSAEIAVHIAARANRIAGSRIIILAPSESRKPLYVHILFDVGKVFNWRRVYRPVDRSARQPTSRARCRQYLQLPRALLPASRYSRAQHRHNVFRAIRRSPIFPVRGSYEQRTDGNHNWNQQRDADDPRFNLQFSLLA